MSTTVGFACESGKMTFLMIGDLTFFYDMNASIYAYSVRALKSEDYLNIFAHPCDAIMMFDTGILDIDSEEDYYLMQVIAKYLFEHKEGFIEIYRQVKEWSKL